MVPVKIGMRSLKRENYNQDENHLLQRHDLDFLEEKQSDSQLRVTTYQWRIVICFNSKVKPRRFQVRDLVLRKVLQNKGVLDPSCKSPFKITEILASKAYKLSYLSGEYIPRSWNAYHLKDLLSITLYLFISLIKFSILVYYCQRLLQVQNQLMIYFELEGVRI